MSQRLSDNSGCGKAIALIGLVASLIAIFAFATGITNVKQLSQPVPSGGQYVQQPIEPTPFQYSNQYSSQSQSPTQVAAPNPTRGTVRVHITAGGAPLPQIQILFVPATKDIAGQWTTIHAVAGDIHTTDFNGSVEVVLDVGTYALVPERAISPINTNSLAGTWGIQGKVAQGDKIQMLIFDIHAGEITDVNIPLARFEVGLLSASGSDAIQSEPVYIYCQGTDIAGKNVASSLCTASTMLTDARGIASFNLGAGTYMLTVLSSSQHGALNVFNINLQQGETRNETYTVGNPIP